MPELPNADDAFDVEKQDAIAEAIKHLSKEEAALFLFHLESKLKKRKIMLTGYIVGIVLWLAGMLGALVAFGLSDTFIGWVFVLPFALVGAALWGFGRWAENVGNRAPPQELVDAAARKQK